MNQGMNQKRNAIQLLFRTSGFGMDNVKIEEEERNESKEEECNSTSFPSLPYYMDSFRFIVTSILENATFNHLFLQDVFSLATLKKFEEMDSMQQRLFVRLFLRKHCWIKRDKIKYDEEFADVNHLLQLLSDAGFLENQMSHVGLEETLTMLSVSQIKQLAKQFRVGTGNSSKSEIILMTLRKVREQRSPFGMPLLEIVRRKAIDLLGNVYRLVDAVRDVFLRILSLFQLTAGISSVIGQNPIFGLLQMNVGLLKFPEFIISCDYSFFTCVADFQLFEKARRMFEDACTLCEERKFIDVKAIYLKALPKWENIIEDEVLTAHVLTLLPFLRKFTAGYYLTKVIEKGLEALERLNEKSDAINGYIGLLDQLVYVQHHRGDWYNRLTILLLRLDKRDKRDKLDKRDKRPNAAAKYLLRGIRDSLIRPQHRLELCHRLRRTMKQLNDDMKKEVNECVEMNLTVRQPVLVEIRGRLCPTENTAKGAKSVFVREKESDVLVSSVEELALAHYLEAGYCQGVHDEGSLFTSLYGLLCWDIIYQPFIPNVFCSQFQTAPLDLTCPSFYSSRQSSIQAKVEMISNQSISDIIADCETVWHAQRNVQTPVINWNQTVGHAQRETVWHAQRNVQTPVINWNRLQSPEYLTGLLNCFEPWQLGRLIKRFAADFGAVRSGFPDLTVWNPTERKMKIVEVKGPNDRLSYKQSIWIDFLMEIGVPVEVCHVVACGAKRKSTVLQ